MTTDTLISSEAHSIEPADLWAQRRAHTVTARAPRLVHAGTCDPWYADGGPCGNRGTTPPAGLRCEAPAPRTAAGSMATMPRGGGAPPAHVQAMDLDAVAGGVRYPSQGLTLYRVAARQVLAAMVRASNDWLADFGVPSPQRLQGSAMLTVEDGADALGELQRGATLGRAGALMPLRPMAPRAAHPEYDPRWAAAQALARPFSRHGGTSRWWPGMHLAAPRQAIVALAQRAGAGRRALAARSFGGGCERSPALQVGAVAWESAWAPDGMHRMDNVYRERAPGVAHPRVPHGALPRDCLRQHVCSSVQQDALGIQLCAAVGVETLLWGSGSPHAAAPCPRSRAIVDRILQGVPDEEKRKIVGEHVARLYHVSGSVPPQRVSTNLVLASLGEETRASCRGPANHHAVTLILPHKLLLGCSGGARGADLSCDRSGIRCRTLGDCATVRNALKDPGTGSDAPRDPCTTVPRSSVLRTPYASHAQRSGASGALTGMRLGLLRESMGCAPGSQAVRLIVTAAAREIKTILGDRLGATLGESSAPRWRQELEVEPMPTDFRRALAKMVPVCMPVLLCRLGPDGQLLCKACTAALVPTAFMPGTIFGTGTLQPLDYGVALAEERLAPRRTSLSPSSRSRSRHWGSGSISRNT